MMIMHIKGATRVLGLSQGYQGLPVKDEFIQAEGEGKIPVMLTAWQPTPEELEALNKGASIHLRILGEGHPPVSMDVGPVPEEG